MTDETLFTIAKLCLQLEGPQTTPTLTAVIEHAATAYGAPNYLVGVRGVIKSTGMPVQYALSNYSKEWKDYYDSHNLSLINPYLRRALNGWGPFRWDEVEADEKEVEYKTLAAHQGMMHGIMCTAPLKPYIGMLAFSGRTPVSKTTWPQHATGLHLLCIATTRAAISIIESANASKTDMPPVELTGEERQCLELTAQGMTAKEVAKELRIKDRSVRYHLECARTKLQVVTKSEAVAEALNRGLIRKRYFKDVKFKGLVE